MKKKRVYVVLLVSILMLSLVLSGCNKGAKPAGEDKPGEEEVETETEPETEPEEVEKPEGESTEDPSDMGLTEEEKARADKRKEEYVKILRNLYENQMCPDGDDLNMTTGEFDDFEENTFAIFDVDGDGEEELIFDYTSTYMAAQFESIYYYNTYSNELVTKLAYSPYNDYYTNGIIKCRASHNHSYCMDLWPYTLKQYSSGAGEYVNIGSVNGWDKELYPVDYNNEPFPDEIDKDGDGKVYFIYEGQDGDEVEPEIVDGDVFESWEENNMKGAFPLIIDKYKLTKYNIDQYEKMPGYVMMVNDTEYTQFVFDDMTYYLPNEFVEKVEIVESETGVTFLHKATGEMGKKVYDYEAMGWIGEIIKSENWDYFDLPHYRYLGYSDTGAYVMILPTDVQFVLPDDYPQAKEHGNEVTKEELTKVMEEYQLLCEMVKDIHPKFAMG